MVQAGTATSVRVREQPQSFNRIDIEGNSVTLTVLAWNGSEFVAEDSKTFRQEEDRWRSAGAPAPEATH